MQTYKLYITDKMGVYEKPVLGKRFTKRKPYFTHHTRTGWRVELWVEVGVNLTQRKMDVVVPTVVWWLVNTLNVRASEIMWVDTRPQKKPSQRRENRGQMELGI